MNLAVSILLWIHGAAHLVGFVVPWRLATFKEMPYKTTLLDDRIDVGDMGIRLVGLVWLVLGLAFFGAGVAVLLSSPVGTPLVRFLAAGSLVMSVLGWPESKFGVLVNALILCGSFIFSRSLP